MFRRSHLIDKKRTRDIDELSVSSDDESISYLKAIIPRLRYIIYLTAESDNLFLNHSIVEVIMVFETTEAADDLARQLALLCQARSECVIYADHIKVTRIAELENKGNFRRIYLAPQSAEAFNSRYNPDYRSKLIMQQLQSLYDLTTVGMITCNISKRKITSRTEAHEPVLSHRSPNHFQPN